MRVANSSPTPELVPTLPVHQIRTLISDLHQHETAQSEGTCNPELSISPATTLSNNATSPGLFDAQPDNLAGLCTSQSVIDEPQALPNPAAMELVPDYFEGDELSSNKLPPYLKGLNITTASSHLTKDEINQLIHYCCVLPPGDRVSGRV